MKKLVSTVALFGSIILLNTAVLASPQETQSVYIQNTTTESIAIHTSTNMTIVTGGNLLAAGKTGQVSWQSGQGMGTITLTMPSTNNVSNGSCSFFISDYGDGVLHPSPTNSPYACTQTVYDPFTILVVQQSPIGN